MFKPVYFPRPLMSPAEIEEHLTASGNKDKKGPVKEARKLTSIWNHLVSRYGTVTVDFAAQLLSKYSCAYEEDEFLTINFDKRTRISDLLKVLHSESLADVKLKLDGMSIRRVGLAVFINTDMKGMPTVWTEKRNNGRGVLSVTEDGWSRLALVDPKCILVMRNRGNMSLETMTY